MSPRTTIVQVQDSVARTYDNYLKNTVQQSVTDANTVSWQTATNAHADFTGVRKGVKIFFSRIPFNGQLNNWVKVAGEHVTVAGLDGGNPPGDMYIRTSTGSAITRINSGNSWTATYSGTSSKRDSTGPGSWFAEFSKLGTYVVDYTTIGNRDGTNGDCATEYLPSGVTGAYCNTETYTFHVGPMADLTVEDGGASSHVATNQHALKIVAVNSGPDESLGAQVTGLPTGAEVIRVSQGTYDRTTGEWDVGELKVRGYYRSAGMPEPTLVLSASASDTASVSIASTKNYEVCIGGKDNPGDLPHTTKEACAADTATGVRWHSTPVYDWKQDNNTATIAAAQGTAGAAQVENTTPNITVEWDPVEYVNGIPVAHYEIEWSADGSINWTTLDDEVMGTLYVDTEPEAGDTRHYGVRPVSQAGVAGPWTAVSSATATASTVTPPASQPASRPRCPTWRPSC